MGKPTKDEWDRCFADAAAESDRRESDRKLRWSSKMKDARVFHDLGLAKRLALLSGGRVVEVDENHGVQSDD